MRAALLASVCVALVGCTQVRVVSAYDGGGEVVVSGPEQNVELEEYLRSRCPANGYSVLFDGALVVGTTYREETVYVGGVPVREIRAVPVTERHVRYECNATYRPGVRPAAPAPPGAPVAPKDDPRFWVDEGGAP